MLSRYGADAWHPALRSLVGTVRAYRHEGRPVVHRGLPAPHLIMVVPVGGPLRVQGAGSPQSYGSLVAGLRTVPVLLDLTGRQEGLQVSLSPAGARALLGVPAGELAGTEVTLPELLGRLGTELVERVQLAPDPAGRLAAVQDVLLRCARRHSAGVRPEVDAAWRLTAAAGGRLAVEAVAREVGWSSRHLRDRFRAETGLTPKEAARVVRFDRSRRLIGGRSAAGSPARLASVAASCGYADQAHLAREWRALAGLAPTSWIEAEFRFVQAAATAGSALSPA